MHVDIDVPATVQQEIVLSLDTWWRLQLHDTGVQPEMTAVLPEQVAWPEGAKGSRLRRRLVTRFLSWANGIRCWWVIRVWTTRCYMQVLKKLTVIVFPARTVALFG